MTAVETRNFLKHEIDFLPESVLNSVRDFVIRQKQFVSEPELAAGQECELCKIYHTPNAETIAALQECRDIASGKIQAKFYNSFEEILAEVKAEMEAEDDLDEE
jgi:predicted RecB family endonuclease